jgi:DNA-binding NarL/FixJ family response regulator
MTPSHHAAEDRGPVMAVGRWDLDIICLLARGSTTREVASALHLSEHLVRRRVSELLQLTASDNRQELVSVAFAVGLILPTWPPTPAEPPSERMLHLLLGAVHIGAEAGLH